MFAKYKSKALKNRRAEVFMQSTQEAAHLKPDDVKKIQNEVVNTKEKVKRAGKQLEGVRARLDTALDQLWAAKNAIDEESKGMDTFDYSSTRALEDSRQNFILREEVVELLDRMNKLGGEDSGSDVSRGRKRTAKPRV